MMIKSAASPVRGGSHVWRLLPGARNRSAKSQRDRPTTASSGDVLAGTSLNGGATPTLDRLTSPVQANVVVEMPRTRIRPGQPDNEAAFQPAHSAAGGTARLEDALGEVYQNVPGLVQHFDGGPSGEPAVLCALIGQPVIAVAQSVWNELCAVGGGPPNGGVVGIGYPAVDRATSPYLGPDVQTIDLIGGTWGRPNGGLRRGRLLRRQGKNPVWQPEIVFDSEASKDRDRWKNQTGKMDLRLCVAARIPLIAGSLRITEPGRDRMLIALARTGITEMIGRLAKRYSLDSDTGGWGKVEEPDGYNDSRFAAYQILVAGDGGRPAIRGGLWLTLPDSYATEVSAIVDLRVHFDVVRPTSVPAIAADLRVTLPGLIDFFSAAWHTTTMVLPLAATDDPVGYRRPAPPGWSCTYRTIAQTRAEILVCCGCSTWSTSPRSGLPAGSRSVTSRWLSLHRSACRSQRSTPSSGGRWRGSARTSASPAPRRE